MEELKHVNSQLHIFLRKGFVMVIRVIVQHTAINNLENIGLGVIGVINDQGSNFIQFTRLETFL